MLSGARNGRGTAGTSPSGRGRVGAVAKIKVQFEKIIYGRKKLHDFILRLNTALVCITFKKSGKAVAASIQTD